MNHPALMNQGIPHEHIAVSEWDSIISKLSARLESCPVEDRGFFSALRFDALAMRDKAYLARERGLRELLEAR